MLRPLSPAHPDDETFEGLLILRPEGRLFFLNGQYVAERIEALVVEHRPRVLAIDMSRVSDIEYSALKTLEEVARAQTESGVVVWVAALNPGVMEIARNAGWDERLGRDQLLFNARAAIEKYRAMQAADAVAPQNRSPNATIR